MSRCKKVQIDSIQPMRDESSPEAINIRAIFRALYLLEETVNCLVDNVAELESRVSALE